MSAASAAAAAFPARVGLATVLAAVRVGGSLVAADFAPGALLNGTEAALMGEGSDDQNRQTQKPSKTRSTESEG